MTLKSKFASHKDTYINGYSIAMYTTVFFMKS